MTIQEYIEPGTYVSEEATRTTVDNNVAVKMYPLYIGRVGRVLPTSTNIVRTSDQNGDPIDAMYGHGMDIKNIVNAYNSSMEYKTDESFLEKVVDADGSVIKLKWTENCQSVRVSIQRKYLPIRDVATYNTYKAGHNVYVAVNMNEAKTEITSVLGPVQFALNDEEAENMMYDFINIESDLFTSKYENSFRADFQYYYKESNYKEVDYSEAYQKYDNTAVSGGSAINDTESGDVNTCPNLKIFTAYGNSESSADKGFIPSEGTVYTVNFTFEPMADSEFFKIKQWNRSSALNIENYYGKDTEPVAYTDEGIGFNPLPVAAQISMGVGENNFLTIAIPSISMVKKTVDDEDFIDIEASESNGIYFITEDSKYVTVDGRLISAESGLLPAVNEYKINIDATYASAYAKALETNCVDVAAENFYRIVPLDQGKNIATVIKNHTTEFSSEEERLECTAFYSIPKSSAYYSNNEYYSAVAQNAKDMNSSRLATSFGRGRRYLSNNQEVWLSTQYLFVAIAAMESLIKNGTGLTNSTIPMTVFDALDVDKMRRTRKNEIAASGVILFEQRPQTEAIKVRHALTTMSSNRFGKELSIQRNIDYTKKYLRNICNPYIGKTNADEETLELVEQTLRSGLGILCEEGWLTEGVITDIAIDEDSEDTIVVRLRVKVPFPLNYIYITLVLE